METKILRVLSEILAEIPKNTKLGEAVRDSIRTLVRSGFLAENDAKYLRDEITRCTKNLKLNQLSYEKFKL